MTDWKRMKIIPTNGLVKIIFRFNCSHVTCLVFTPIIQIITSDMLTKTWNTSQLKMTKLALTRCYISKNHFLSNQFQSQIRWLCKLIYLKAYSLNIRQCHTMLQKKLFFSFYYDVHRYKRRLFIVTLIIFTFIYTCNFIVNQ